MWPEWNNLVRSRSSLDFVRSCFNRAHPLEPELPYAIKYFKLIIHIGLNVFEAIDLYRTLDLKSNPMDSSHFENNFKRIINCPVTRGNMNEPSTQMINRCYHCSVTHFVQRRKSYSFTVTWLTSRSNDSAIQNESKWKFQWRKCRRVLFSQYKSCDESEWRFWPWVTPVTAYVNSRWFNDTFS